MNEDFNDFVDIYHEILEDYIKIIGVSSLQDCCNVEKKVLPSTSELPTSKRMKTFKTHITEKNDSGEEERS
jgi:hypothetical protein